MNKKIVRWQGSYCRLESSCGARGILFVHMNRTTRTGQREFTSLEIEIDRSSIACIYRALKQFADRERKEVGALPV